MSDGVHALQGFKYQATVILDVLLERIQAHQDLQARPEGADDLELVWTENGSLEREFIQIKKPREDNLGRLTRDAWTIAEVAKELMPGTIAHLNGNGHVQRWILGDAIDPDVAALCGADTDNVRRTSNAYWQILHLLARDQSKSTSDLSDKARRSIGQWHFKPDSNVDPMRELHRLISEFGARITSLGATADQVQSYEHACRSTDKKLPEVFFRIRIDTTFGSDQQIRARVCDRVAARFPVSVERIATTIFGNMKQFVDDIATQRGRWILSSDLDNLIMKVWPEMMLLREPRPLPSPYIERRSLVDQVFAVIPNRAIEVIGVAGSGKTSFARALFDRANAQLSKTCVCYAELHPDRTLRELLTSIAHRLRGIDGGIAWERATLSNITEEQRAESVAKALRDSPTNIVAFVDLVDGDCNEEFARLLPTFLENLPPVRHTFIFLGQKSALRRLTPLERKLAAIPQTIEQLGFQFQEFAEIVAHFLPRVDRDRLWGVYQRAVGGRPAGLIARLAYDLARAGSIEVLEQIVAGSPEDIVPRAILKRFDEVGTELRPAAEKLVCMMLPFTREDVNEIFREDPTKRAIDELITLGLLHHHDQIRLEMHELVRQSLEEGIPPARRAATHSVLASWYRRQDRISAEIYHLDKAGKHDVACQRAREAFMSGKHWNHLWGYVAKHALVTSSEIEEWIVQDKVPQHSYALTLLLERLGDAATEERLWAHFVRNREKYDSDSKWGEHIVSAILTLNSNRSYDFVSFALEASDLRLIRKRLMRIEFAARASALSVDSRLLARFRRESDLRIKFALLDVLAMDPTRDVLREIMPFLDVHDLPRENPHSCVERRGPPITLHLRNRNQMIDFLASIPSKDLRSMVERRSPNFGNIAKIIWAKRETLRPVCIEVLESGKDEIDVQFNALRVLVVLADERAPELAEMIRNRNAQDAVTFVAAVMPSLFDRTIYERWLFDLNRDTDLRVCDLSVLVYLDADLDLLLNQLLTIDAPHANVWKQAFLEQCNVRPGEWAIPLLEEAINQCSDPAQMQQLAWTLEKLGEIPGSPVTDMLLRPLFSPWPQLRVHACRALLRRRTKRALNPLVALYHRENHPQVRQAAIVAAVASGPDNLEELEPFWIGVPGVEHWRYIIAGRLRDESAAPMLIAAARDRTKSWQLRRAAILAASRLPFELALEPIAESILAERLSFTNDRSAALLAYQVMIAIIPVNIQVMFRNFLAGKPQFIDLFGEIFHDCIKDNLYRYGCPSGVDIAEWLYDRLKQLRWSPETENLEQLVNELHIPMLHDALLRGLRLAGRYDIIEQAIVSADSVWLVVRSCSEWANGRIIDEPMVARLEKVVGGSPFSDSPFPANVLRSLKERIAREGRPVPQSQPLQPIRVFVDDVLHGMDKVPPRERSTYQIEWNTEQELQRLIQHLDPLYDYGPDEPTTAPEISLTRFGASITRQQRSKDNKSQVRRELRPALAATCPTSISIPWHERSFQTEPYFSVYLQHVGAARNRDRFYHDLAHHTEVMMMQIDDRGNLNSIHHILDERIIPYLQRYGATGTDHNLEALCSMAVRVDAPGIAVVICQLFRRWLGRFDKARKHVPEADNYAFWSSLAILSSHPRFRDIPDYDLRLIELLDLPIPSFHREMIVRILSECPRAYVHLEMLLLEATPFEHHSEDEVDRLDAAADTLFNRVAED